jgi:regulator of RNase E activity RraA
MVTIDLPKVRGELGSAVISDVLDARGLRHQCLAAGLAPLENDTVIAGYAFPVTIRRVYDVPEKPFAGLVAALDAIGEDEVFVTPTQRASDIAVWGELLSTACMARGAAGAITDGLVRDTRQVRELGFPVVSAGTIPYDSMGRHEIAGHGIPISIDGVRIAPRDLLVADSDGVVVVPSTLAVEVVDDALNKRASELEFRRAVAGGMAATQAFHTFGVL